MSFLTIGIAFLIALWWGLWRYRRMTPDKRIVLVRQATAALAIVAAIALALTGRFFWAAPLAIFGYLVFWRPNGWRAPGRIAGTMRLASVRTAFLEMTLDRTSGALSGHVLAGALAGRDLGGLSRDELALLFRECRAAEAQSRQLLEAYLDRRWPEWRAEMPRASDGAANGGNGSAGEAGSGQSGRERGRAPMTKAEAFDVLGLPQGASADEIKAAHRSLMKRLHPDQGGSNYLAAKINEAKEILTGKRA